MSDRPLSIGVIGCGRVATGFHLPALRRLKGVVIGGIADSDPDALANAGKRFNIDRQYPDYQTLLRQPEIDVVAICTPTLLHVDMALAALDAGKHVLVEKPLALSTAEANRLIARAKQTDRQITVGFVLRHHRLIAQARAAVQLGILGTLEAIHTHWTIPVQFRAGVPDWRKQRATGGGALIDFAVHHIDLWRYLCDTEVQDVSALSHSGRTDDQTVTVSARLANGVLANTTVSEASTDSHELHLFGHFGVLHLSMYRFDGMHFEPIFSSASATRHWAAQVGTLFRELPFGFTGRGEGGEYGRAFENEWAHFLHCIRTTSVPLVSLEDGLRATEVLVAAARSADTHCPVVVKQGSVASSLPAGTSLENAIPAPTKRIPVLSVVVGTPDTFDTPRLLLKFLAAQTIADQIEIVLVAPSAEWLRLDEEALQPFAAYKIIEIGPIQSLATLQAAGVRAASAPLVAFSEDHAFPSPNWAEALVAAHQPGYAAVFPAIRNANPDHPMAWADALLCYGAWLGEQQAGIIQYAPWHHSCYARDALLAYGDRLTSMLEAQTVLQDDLRRQNLVLFLEPHATIRHVHVSRLTAWLPSVYYLGRLYAAYRSKQWSPARRLVYGFGSPLIPVLRFARSIRLLRGVGVPRTQWLRVAVWLVVGLSASAIGECMGYLRGEGNSKTRLLPYEFHRWRQTHPADWTRFAASMGLPK